VPSYDTEAPVKLGFLQKYVRSMDTNTSMSKSASLSTRMSMITSTSMSTSTSTCKNMSTSTSKGTGTSTNSRTSTCFLDLLANVCELRPSPCHMTYLPSPQPLLSNGSLGIVVVIKDVVFILTLVFR
jgi:hypothetical protein